MPEEKPAVDKSAVVGEEKKPAEEEKIEKPVIPQFIGNGKTTAITGKTLVTPDIRDLVEKNLKWSQIIYEQNRRIIRRLFWSTLLAWFKWIVILGVLGASVWYGWPLMKNLVGQYQNLLGQFGIITSGIDTNINAADLQKKLDGLNLTPQQAEQVKAMIK
ncbi:MAG: hypothetical protein WC457_04855 [Patescibacteria group bacterium]